MNLKQHRLQKNSKFKDKKIPPEISCRFHKVCRKRKSTIHFAQSSVLNAIIPRDNTKFLLCGFLSIFYLKLHC